MFRIWNGIGKCSEFGMESKSIAEFHTHPGKYDENPGAFSGQDIMSFIKEPENKVNCVVKEVKHGNTRNIRVRCAKSKDVNSFVQTVAWKEGNEINDKNVYRFMSDLNNIPSSKQDKFSCFVDFPLGSQYKDISQLKKEEKKRKPSLYKKLYGNKRRGFPL